MNSLGAGLVWSSVQVSLLVLAGGFVYLLLRRRGPAAGANVALTLLVIAIGLPILSLAPWPNWWRLHVAGATADRAVRSAESFDVSPGAAATADSTGSRAGIGPKSADAGQESFASMTWAKTFWQSFWGGLGDRHPFKSDTRYGWPSVAAWLLLAGMALGLTRLALGLSAVGAYRRRTQPVTDKELIAIRDAMRVRLGCPRQIELRESAQIAAPATVGWRRPLILLPLQWREWSVEERRVVLAHEVAHVGRNDFAGWLVAQLSVVLHFYNPLVHWLARRLRIEQELAADAWGAMAAGGSGPYLTTLASMALRQDDRMTNWAARPFLPARGTLLRRIEMLRNRKLPQTFALSRRKRIVLWSVLATLGLFIAGLRGPEGEALAGDDATPVAEATGLPAAVARTPIDLAFVPSDPALVVAVRPAAIVKTPAGKLLAQAFNSEPMKLEQSLGLSIAEIEYVKFVMNDVRSGAPPRIIVRSSKPHDWAKFAASMVHDPVEVESTIAATAGKKFFKPGRSALHTYPADAALCYFLADDRTIVFAPEREMTLVIAATINPEPEPKWAKTWRRAATGNLAIMLDVERLRKLIEPELKQGSDGPMPAMIAMFGPLWQDSTRLFVGTEIADKQLGLLALAECPSDEAATRVQQTTQALLTMALNGLTAVRKGESGGPADAIAIKKILVDAAEELLKKAQVTREGSTVIVQSQGSGATLLAAAGIALPALAKSREAASRATSMNNLKQFGLAMFNYESTYQSFPPHAIYSKDGKPLLSWRVSILPFLDQDALYKQFRLDEPWDSPNNKPLIAKMPKVFQVPSDEKRDDGMTRYLVPVGTGTIFDGDRGTKISEIKDGTSQTLLIIEVGPDKAVTWTKPDDMPFDAEKPLASLGTIPPGGFCAAFADGSVRVIRQSINPGTFRKLILRNDGQPIDASEL